MKKRFFSLAVVALFSATLVNATVWRVSNVNGADADFTSINEANNSTMVQSGDTLYIEPSATTYAQGIISKQLIIIGNGYFLTENPETQANTNTSTINGIVFNSGSAGSAIVGCAISSNSLIYTSNIRFERNYLTSTFSIYVSNVSDVIIIGNFITSLITSNNSTGINNVLISGNFIERTAGSPTITFGPEVSAVIENNVIQGVVNINNSIFHNNILRAGSFTATNTVYYNNIGNDNQFGTANGNQQYVNMADVFPGTGSTDGKWQLKPGSPAIGAGTAGQDCGMFDGPHPYKLSGIPAIPAIYEYLQIYNSASQEINVNFSVKSQN